ncbi:MAG: molybdate ABC transporter substrate-binding protein [Dysgonamonadaceae bacterium]|jgi:molybdate transport system substrate-binding protein|nr:molybdate ABC transporter substrate-binding protein [Dysgonamonadaceae bacterium]
MKKRFVFISVVLFSLLVGNMQGQTVKVAAAANLRYALEEIKKQYEAGNPAVKVEITFGSSGLLTQQILNGAPFDFFMAADTDFPEKVSAAGFAAGKVETYIYGKLALWSLSLDVSNGLEALFLPAVKKIAVADPKKAPYGKSAVELLKSRGMYDRINSKIVWGDNISQTAQFAFSGNADRGFIALSLALAPDMQGKGSCYVFPETICPPLEQACVLIKGSEKNGEALKFKQYVISPSCDSLWEKYGYGLLKR